MPCTKVKRYLQFPCGWNLALYAGIVEGIAVLQRQPAICKGYWRIDWRIDVPGSKLGKFSYTEFGTIGMAVGFGLNRDRDMGNPHVLFIHGVGYP